MLSLGEKLIADKRLWGGKPLSRIEKLFGHDRLEREKKERREGGTESWCDNNFAAVVWGKKKVCDCMRRGTTKLKRPYGGRHPANIGFR